MTNAFLSLQLALKTYALKGWKFSAIGMPFILT
jgi:hypothetical protein